MFFSYLCRAYRIKLTKNASKQMGENNSTNGIQLKPIRELQGMNFFIPEYQRGYRWKTRQVLDLLDDIDEFMNNNSGGMYCLQPLVVKKRDVKNDQQLLKEIRTKENIQDIKDLLAEQWEVVDGQQRLTTLFILIKILDSIPYYQIDYATREDSSEFLKEIKGDAAQKYIDYMHIYNTQCQIITWFETHQNVDKDDLKNAIINRTEFIWYECNEDPIEVFTRLNIGKISLTNSELVKALFLNSSNFASDKIRQNEIAVLWDRMEYALQKDEFWCFIHEDGYDQPTRIDFILELFVKLMKESNKKYKKNEKNDGIKWEVNDKDLGDDHYRTFRYFYHLFKNNKKKNKKEYQEFIEKVWGEIKNTFDILVEWYNDNECYHYIGFLVHDAERNKEVFNFVKLINLWNSKHSQEKEAFKKVIKGQDDKPYGFGNLRNIKDVIKDIINLDNQYEIDKNESKTACYPLLLLFNIQTIINKNNKFKEDGKFDALDFERFPFNLFKKEKGWDIEHIAPNTDCSLPKEDDRLELLNYAVKSIADNDLKTRIESYIKGNKEVSKNNNGSEADAVFYNLRRDIEIEIGTLDENERNKIWNFCLLDQSTNRSYGNSIFALKRKEILLRERGLDVDGKTLSNDANDKAKKRLVFIPACTLNAFTKFYSPEATDLSVWSIDDARNYRKAIYQTLKDFGVNYKD